VTESIVVRSPMKLHNPEFAEQLIRLAASGMSRRGLCHVADVGYGDLANWLHQGRAQPEREPYGTFARRFLAAERAHELLGTQVISQHLHHIKRKRVKERTENDIRFVERNMARRFPKEHGAGEGLVALRQLDPELDIEGWWAKQGLDHEQLRALLREPPDTLKAAIQAEPDAVYQMLLDGGWTPPKSPARKGR
jgi:hypothetical protein